MIAETIIIKASWWWFLYLPWLWFVGGFAGAIAREFYHRKDKKEKQTHYHITK